MRKRAKNEHEVELLQQLQNMARMVANSYKDWQPSKNYVYQSHYQAVIQNGWFFDVPPQPIGNQKGKAKECYRNAGLAALDKDQYLYCEGYAINNLPLALEHAWNFDLDTLQVAEFTPSWRGTATAYYGIVVNTQQYTQELTKFKKWGLFGWHNYLKDGFPEGLLYTP